jgi:hypothetical protein
MFAQSKMENDFIPKFLNKLFSEFDRLKINYCVLHSYDGLPDKVVSDVDMAIDERGRRMLHGVLKQLAMISGWKIVQDLHYDVPNLHYFVFSSLNGANAPSFIQADFHRDDKGINRYYLTTDVLLKNRRPLRNFYIPEGSVEACYLIIKRIIKGELKEKDRLHIRGLYQEDIQGLRPLLRSYFGTSKARYIEHQIIDEAWDGLSSQIKNLRRTLFTKNRLKNPLDIVRYCFWQAIRIYKRLKRPTGLVVVILGPDGGGKSSVAQRILKDLEKGFRRTKYCHLRLGLFPSIRSLLTGQRRPEGIVTEPHKEPPYGFIVSFLRFIYYALDYILGYYFKTYWFKVRTGLLVIDRYYYDYLIDPIRYRMDLPC